MKRILSIFLIILLSCIINLNGETRGINKKALRRMIEHMTRIKNLLRNLDEEDTTGSEDNFSSSEESGNESSEESGSEPSEDGSQSSEESGSEPSESGSQESEESGSEPSSESGSQESEESWSEPSNESGSQSSEESGSEPSNESGSQSSEESTNHSSEESGSQESGSEPSKESSEESSSQQSQESGSEPSQESGSQSSQESGGQSSDESGSQQSQESGSQSSQESGSQSSQESGSQSSQESSSQSSQESGSQSSQESGSQSSQESGIQFSPESGIQFSPESGIQFSPESGSQSSQESGSQSSQESGSQSSQESESTSFSSNPANGTEPTSSIPTAPPTSLITGTIITNNRRARIHFLGINNFRIPQSTLFTFVVYILFLNRPPASMIRFKLTILYRRRLRYLQEVGNETATCTQADSEQTGGNVKYFCTSPKDANSEIDQIAINPVIIIDNETFSASSGDINFSEEAALAALNLEKQTKIADKMSELQNGQLIVYPNKYFVIKGDVDDYEGKVGDDLVLVVYDNSTDPSTPINVSCTVQNITNKEYEFKCTPTQSVKGNIYLSPMYYGNNAINLNMTSANSDYLSFSMDGSVNNGTTIRNNPIYRKSSSGLSWGAIAGIVIACAVVLIIASIVAMMLRKPSSTLANNNSSVIGLRTIDNYTE